MTMDLQTLAQAVEEDAAFRVKRRLQPIGGPGDKIFPPTYPPPQGSLRNAPPRHVFERRRVDGGEVWCVLLDSVQSQANRLEEALLAAAEGEDEPVPLPFVAVDFSGAGLEPLERITSLDAPHRVYDAILRDSLLDGSPLMQSEEGRRLAAAKPADATALLELSPNALLFGAWHSQGEGGGFGAKFPRALVSEIMGVDTPVEELAASRRTGQIEARGAGQPARLGDLMLVAGGDVEGRSAGRRTGSRIDPLGILKDVRIYKSAEADGDWTPFEEEAAQRNSQPVLFRRKKGDGAKAGKPSVINHGNIVPTVEPLGVTCDHAEHRATITLAGMRRLRFGGGKRDAAGRALLVSLGLLALAEQDVRGYSLRSRCDLVCDGAAPLEDGWHGIGFLELVHADGSTAPVELGRAAARALYREAYAQAETAGFKFRSLVLKPQDKLVEIVRRSRQLALEGRGGESEDDEPSP